MSKIHSRNDKLKYNTNIEETDSDNMRQLAVQSYSVFCLHFIQIIPGLTM